MDAFLMRLVRGLKLIKTERCANEDVNLEQILNGNTIKNEKQKKNRESSVTRRQTCSDGEAAKAPTPALPVEARKDHSNQPLNLIVISPQTSSRP